MSAEAFDFALASIVVVLQGVDDEGLTRFAAAFEPAAFGGKLASESGVEALVNECLPGHPDEAREVAVLVDQLVSLARLGCA